MSSFQTKAARLRYLTEWARQTYPNLYGLKGTKQGDEGYVYKGYQMAVTDAGRWVKEESQGIKTYTPSGSLDSLPPKKQRVAKSEFKVEPASEEQGKHARKLRRKLDRVYEEILESGVAHLLYTQKQLETLAARVRKDSLPPSTATKRKKGSRSKGTKAPKPSPPSGAPLLPASSEPLLPPI